jgi:hypothetical protein
VRLLRRPEILLDADVDLMRPALEPEATSGCERRGLRQLREPKQLTEEPSRLDLAFRWCGELHVVDAEEGDGRRLDANDHAVAVPRPDTAFEVSAERQGAARPGVDRHSLTESSTSPAKGTET